MQKMEGNLEGDIFDTLLVNNTIGIPTMLFRKSSFLEAVGLMEGCNASKARILKQVQAMLLSM